MNTDLPYFIWSILSEVLVLFLYGEQLAITEGFQHVLTTSNTKLFYAQTHLSHTTHYLQWFSYLLYDLHSSGCEWPPIIDQTKRNYVHTNKTINKPTGNLLGFFLLNILKYVSGTCRGLRLRTSVYWRLTVANRHDVYPVSFMFSISGCLC